MNNAPRAQYLDGPSDREDERHCNFCVRATDGLPFDETDAPHLERQCAGERGHGPFRSWCAPHAECFAALSRRLRN